MSGGKKINKINKIVHLESISHKFSVRMIINRNSLTNISNCFQTERIQKQYFLHLIYRINKNKISAAVRHKITVRNVENNRHADKRFDLNVYF